MAKIYGKITDLIGHTPLLELCDYMSENGCGARILAKLEYLNPAGSVKDRIAVKMIDEAERTGVLHRADVIIEPTSGNTGIGLACVAAARGYRLIITMPGKKKTFISLWSRNCPYVRVQRDEGSNYEGK